MKVRVLTIAAAIAAEPRPGMSSAGRWARGSPSGRFPRRRAPYAPPTRSAEVRQDPRMVALYVGEGAVGATA